MAQIDYDLLFERIVDNGSKMSDDEFCERFGYKEKTLSQFWSRELPFNDTELVETMRKMARESVKKHIHIWKEKGFETTDLLNYACSKIGIPYEMWTSKYWVRFSEALSGNDDLLTGIENEVEITI